MKKLWYIYFALFFSTNIVAQPLNQQICSAKCYVEFQQMMQNTSGMCEGVVTNESFCNTDSVAICQAEIIMAQNKCSIEQQNIQAQFFPNCMLKCEGS
jgi:hypothetical protein